MLKITSIKPTFNGVVTTMDKYATDQYENGVILNGAGAIKEYQTVVAIGSMVKDINVGDKVMINPIRYKHNKGTLKDGVITDNPVIGYEFKTVTINNKECLYLADNDIQFIFEGEEVEQPAPQTGNPLILPDHKVIV